jgi:hypothetical protein
MATIKAINTKPVLKQFDFHAAALQFRPGPDRTQLSFAFEAPARELQIMEDKQWSRVHLAITALVKDQNGQVVEKISKDLHYEVPAEKTEELKRGVVSFTMPFWLAPGRYTLETAAVDRESMKASVSRSAIEVEQDSGLSMSDLTLVRRVEDIQERNAADPLQARGGQVLPELFDTISVDPGALVQFYAVAYPPEPVEGPVEMDMEISRDGETVGRAPTSEVPPEAGGAAPVLARLPVEKLLPGHYEAQLTFRYKGQEVTRVAAFDVSAEQ